jgi:hypothetical protein
MKLRKKPLYITCPVESSFTFHSTWIHYTFYILIIITLSACSSTTEVPKGSLSGTVHLEDETDHSGIIVAVYDLAELDSDIVSINQEYPHIGVIISQHTEFDHRLQTHVKYSETDAAGNFEIKKIPTGTYNLVAMKAGWGFRYIYEFEIEKGENALTPSPSPRGRGEELTPQSSSRMLSGLRPDRPTPLFNPIEGEHKEVPLRLVASEYHEDGKNGVLIRHRRELIYPVESLYSTGKGVNLDRRGSDLNLYPQQNRTSDFTLFPEQHISGDWLEDVSVEPWHHLVIDDDTNLVPGTSLTLGPNAVIRINPGCDLKIYGEIYAQGEENNMFWITSNDGFDSSLLLTTYFPREELSQYNFLELSSIASVSGDLIEWGKFDFANTCLLNQVNNLHMQNGIFRNSGCGFYSSLNLAENDSTFCINILCENVMGESGGGIYYLNVNNGAIEKSILYNCYNGAKIKDQFEGSVFNNKFLENTNGIFILHFVGDIHNCEFELNDKDILYTGNHYQNEVKEVNIYLNVFSSIFGLYTIGLDSYIYYSPININYNNFHNTSYFIYCYYYRGGYINAINNCFDTLNSEEQIMEKITEEDTFGYEIIVDIIPFETNIIEDAGIY